MRYIFENYTLDSDARELSKEGEAIGIEPQVFGLLELLISHAGKIVTKETINETVWNGRIVSEAAVNSRVRSARLAIGDSGKDQRLIKTVHGIGFKFIGDVEIENQVSEPESDKIELSKGVQQNLWRTSLFALVAVLIVTLIWNVATNNNAKRNSASVEAQSIAVLPFADMSDTGDQVYFGDGIAEEILNMLAKEEDLQVASRTSSFVFRDSEKSIKDISNALGVKYLIEGSIRKFDNRLRITAQLIDAQNDAHLWSDTYDLYLSTDDLFEVQSQISNTVLQSIGGHLLINVKSGPQPITASAQAYDAYLRAQALQDRRLLEPLMSARDQFSAAITIDPRFALAYAGRALVQCHMSLLSGEAMEERLANIRQDLGFATSYAPESTEVLHAAACLAFLENRYTDAVKISEIVTKRNNNYAASYELSGEALLKLGRLTEAADVLEQGLTLNPISPYMLNLLADVKLRLGDFEGAFELAQSNYQWNPDNAHAMDMIGYIHWNQGNYAKAHEIYSEAKAANPSDSYITDALIMIYAELGLIEQAEALAQTPTTKAFAYALTGKHQEAAALLNDPVDSIEDGEVAYMIGDITGAAVLMEQQVIDETMLSIKPISFGNGDLYAEACFIFTRVSHDYAEPICEKTANFYTDTRPDSFLRSSDINGGIIWHMTRGNLDAAMTWLEDLNRRGVYDPFFLKDPALAGIKNHPRFEAFYETMMKGVAEQRRRVEAQL